MKIITSTGIELTNDYGMTKSLFNYAKQKGMNNITVWYNKESNTYLLCINNQPEFESTSTEAIAVHIDMLSIKEK